MSESKTPCMEKRCKYHAAYADQMKLEIKAVYADLAAARAEVERLRKDAERWQLDAERWQFVRSKVSRILNERTLKMDGLRVEVYYDEQRAFFILPKDNAALFDEAIDAARAAKEPRP